MYIFLILQDKVVGNVFHFFKLIQVLLHFVSFLIWIHLTVFNFYIHLYTKSTIFIFYFPCYPFVSDQWYEFWVKSSMNSDLFFGSFTPDFEQNEPYLFIFRGLTTTEILVWVLYLLSTVLEIWLYSCFLFVFHWWPLNIWPDLDLDLFDSHLILLNLPF